MKKLGQKLSFLTKIMLVIGLLISNLSSLSVVFAYEVPTDIVIDRNDEDLEISYIEELAEEVEAVDVKVYENYTYLDGNSIEQVVTKYSLTAEQLLAAKEGELELVHETIFTSEEVEGAVEDYKLFDGTYKAKVEIIDVTDYSENVALENDNSSEVELDGQATEIENDQEVIETVITYGTYEEEITHESGLNIKLFDETGTEITLVDGKYPVSLESTKVRVITQVLSGGLVPSDIYVFENKVYTASELIGEEFGSETDFASRLYGEYELPVEVKLLKQLPVSNPVEDTVVPESTDLVGETSNNQYEELIYTDSVSIMYESYEMNASVLNMVAISEGYGEDYLFYSDTKDGVLYVLPTLEEEVTVSEETVTTKTVLDLYNMLNVAVSTGDETVESPITYTILKDGVNVLESYVPASEEDTLEAYLATIALDDTVSITLSSEGLTITYRVVFAGDLNNDNILTEEDVLELINQFVGESEIVDLEKSDVYGFDEEVNSLDVLYLNQVVKSKVWGLMINDEEVALDSALEVKKDGEALGEENYLTSGDEFTVDYILSLSDYEVNGIAGLFDYDETLFELVSVETSNEWIGNSYEGKFIYLGEESLTGPELEEADPETETPSEEVEDETTENLTAVLTETPEMEEEIPTVDYVMVTATFKALSATNEESNNVITLDGIELFNSTSEGTTYYVLDQTSVSTEAIVVTASDDNSLQYLEVAGTKIDLEDGVYEYEITVSNDVTAVDLKYILGNVAASVTSEIYPEELAEGSNTIILTITSETGVSQDYTITVIREEVEEETTTTQVNYGSSSNTTTDDTTKEEVVTPGTSDEEVDDDKEEEEGNLSRIIIIILILIVIAGLVYLIFKDEDDDDTKKANKEVNKLKKESIVPETKVTSKTTTKVSEKAPSKNNTKTTSKSSNTKSGSTSKNKTSKTRTNNKN